MHVIVITIVQNAVKILYEPMISLTVNYFVELV